MNVVITFFLYLYLMRTKINLINFNNTLKMFFFAMQYILHTVNVNTNHVLIRINVPHFLSGIQKSEIQTKLQENSHCLDFLECFRFHLIIK